MNVLSLFDGISCGQIALNKAGVKIEKYYASEIDKHAMKVTQHNYPNTVQVGDVTKLDVASLDRIDLLIGGSPCQSLSRAGDGSGFDGKSKLFFEYVRVLKDIRKSNPDAFFFLENVKMKKEWEDVISKELNVTPLKINSNISSGQNRERLYWTNIPYAYTKLPDVSLQSILEPIVSADYYLTDLQKEKLNFLKGTKAIKREKNGYSYQFKEGSISFPNDLNKKSQCLCATGQPIARTSTYVSTDGKIRKITPVEAERLQTIPDNYTLIAEKDSFRYKLVGNAWTVNVIFDFFRNL